MAGGAGPTLVGKSSSFPKGLSSTGLDWEQCFLCPARTAAVRSCGSRTAPSQHPPWLGAFLNQTQSFHADCTPCTILFTISGDWAPIKINVGSAVFEMIGLCLD